MCKYNIVHSRTENVLLRCVIFVRCKMKLPQICNSKLRIRYLQTLPKNVLNQKIVDRSQGFYINKESTDGDTSTSAVYTAQQQMILSNTSDPTIEYCPLQIKTNEKDLYFVNTSTTKSGELRSHDINVARIHDKTIIKNTCDVLAKQRLKTLFKAVILYYYFIVLVILHKTIIYIFSVLLRINRSNIVYNLFFSAQHTVLHKKRTAYASCKVDREKNFFVKIDKTPILTLTM